MDIPFEDVPGCPNKIRVALIARWRSSAESGDSRLKSFGTASKASLEIWFCSLIYRLHIVFINYNMHILLL
jgi:hypothetical protein